MKSYAILSTLIHFAVAVPLYTSSTTTRSHRSTHGTSWSSTRRITPTTGTTTASSRSRSNSVSATTTLTPTTSPTTITTRTMKSTTTTSSSVWQPNVGTTWQYTLSDEVNIDSSIEEAEVWFIDLFDSSAEDVASLHQRGRKVVAYFSAGTWEDWRDDASDFNNADIGKALGDWPGEKYLNIKASHVRQIMLARLDLAAEKGFDGVDPDNMDGYSNNNGFNLTKADTIDYALFLAQAAHSRGLSIGLKNAGEIVPNVISQMQWMVQEQAIQYGEEQLATPFIQAGKPVFNVEYPKGTDASNAKMNTNKNVDDSTCQRICNRGKSLGFSTIIKNVKLDQWVQTC